LLLYLPANFFDPTADLGPIDRFSLALRSSHERVLDLGPFSTLSGTNEACDVSAQLLLDAAADVGPLALTLRAGRRQLFL